MFASPAQTSEQSVPQLPSEMTCQLAATNSTQKLQSPSPPTKGKQVSISSKTTARPCSISSNQRTTENFGHPSTGTKIHLAQPWHKPGIKQNCSSNLKAKHNSAARIRGKSKANHRVTPTGGLRGPVATADQLNSGWYFYVLRPSPPPTGGQQAGPSVTEERLNRKHSSLKRTARRLRLLKR